MTKTTTAQHEVLASDLTTGEPCYSLNIDALRKAVSEVRRLAVVARDAADECIECARTFDMALAAAELQELKNRKSES